MFIGDKQIKQIINTGEKTFGGIEIIKVEFEDGSTETFSKLMYDKIISEQTCDATALRERRVFPIVEAVLITLREWGIKLNELPYMSAVLNQSLSVNEKEALRELWLQYIPNLKTIDDVDLIAVDRVLKYKQYKTELNADKK